ncbi:GNAT family N-acetyltransferase [Microbacterium sp.]|uniref:GNAT family N-acetyltransferase n=1 Tax=Microbacterium sp. TaxID=51671 RepID=UPI003C73F0A7
MRLRPFVPGDYPAIAAWVCGPDELRAFAGDRLTWPLTEHEFLDLIDAPGRTAWTTITGDDPGTPIGHVQLTRTEAGTRISRLIVDPAHRGAGHGRALLDHAIRRAHPATPIRLSVLAENTIALGLYVRTGFVPTGRDEDILHLTKAARRSPNSSAIEQFDELAEAMSWLGARRAHMMGRPMLSIDGRMLACLDDGNLGLRLGRGTPRHSAALSIAGAGPFAPGDRGRAFHDWVALPVDARSEWAAFTYDALEHTRLLGPHNHSRRTERS